MPNQTWNELTFIGWDPDPIYEAGFLVVEGTVGLLTASRLVLPVACNLLSIFLEQRKTRTCHDMPVMCCNVGMFVKAQVTVRVRIRPVFLSTGPRARAKPLNLV